MHIYKIVFAYIQNCFQRSAISKYDTQETIAASKNSQVLDRSGQCVVFIDCMYINVISVDFSLL